MAASSSASASRVIAWAERSSCLSGRTLIWQSKRIHSVSGCRDNVLFAIDSVTHRTTPHSVRTVAHVHTPKRLAGFSIEREEDAVPPSTEHHSACGGKHPRLGELDHLEFPLLVAGLRINSSDCAIPCAECVARPGRGGRPVVRWLRLPKAGPPTVSGIDVAFPPWTNGLFARKAFGVFRDSHIKEPCLRI